MVECQHYQLTDNYRSQLLTIVQDSTTILKYKYKKMNIFWFRRDLRLNDNVALFHALSENEAVLPIFIFDNTILDQLEKNDARVEFIQQQLSIINNKLKLWKN